MALPVAGLIALGGAGAATAGTASPDPSIAQPIVSGTTYGLAPAHPGDRVATRLPGTRTPDGAGANSLNPDDPSLGWHPPAVVNNGAPQTSWTNEAPPAARQIPGAQAQARYAE